MNDSRIICTDQAVWLAVLPVLIQPRILTLKFGAEVGLRDCGRRKPSPLRRIGPPKPREPLPNAAGESPNPPEPFPNPAGDPSLYPRLEPGE